MKYIFTILSVLFFTCLHAQNVNLVWAKKMGGASADYGISIAVDASGNVYTTGQFSGTADFDPGPGTYNLTAAGSNDIFVSKLDASANLVWAKNMGGTDYGRGNSIAVDASGNVYTTGFFTGTVDFDPGSGTYNLTSAGYYDIFVSKLDAFGNFVWAKKMGGAYFDEGNSIAVDALGNVYTTGYFQRTVDFDPGAGTYNLTAAGTNDIFVSKLDASGNFVWAKKMGGTDEQGNSITVDASGNVYTTGVFFGTADFDPGAGTYNLTSAGQGDIFVSKLDVSGNFVWAKKMGGADYDAGNSIAVDASGNVFTTGYFFGTANFDPGAGTYNLTAAVQDIFVSKLNASGNFVWAKKMGGASYDEGNSIAVDALGNVYTTGYFGGTANFDPGAGTYNLTSAGYQDIFVSKLNASGNFVWAKKMGGASIAYGYSIAVDASGNVYTTGYFFGTADFDPGAGTYNLTAAGTNDIFISKLDASGNFVWAKNMGDGSSAYGHSIAVDASGNVYTTGRFSGTADFDPGPGTYNLISAAGSQDIFISKLNASGNLVWAKNMGGAYSDRGTSIAVDASGNVYTTGFFQGTADFDPGAGTYNLTAAVQDIFVSKLDSSGNFVWAKNMGGAAYDAGESIAVDASGNVYTTGFFQGTTDFDPGPGTYNLTSAGSNDIFVSKLDLSGNFVWAKNMGGGGAAIAYGYSIAVDASFNVYTTGFFTGTADFNPGAGTYNLTSAGQGDIFVSKLDVSGNFVWAKKMGGASYDIGYSIAVDASFNVYTTGYFSGTTDFDPGPGIYNLTSAGAKDIFVSKLDASGNFVWAKKMGGAGAAIAYGYSIAVDASFNVYTTGFFTGTADFDPGPGTYNLTSAAAGSSDIFVSKLDASGNFVWAKKMGGAYYDIVTSGISIAIDASGNVFTTGSFQGTADFDPGPGTYYLSSAGIADVFVVKLSQAAALPVTWLNFNGVLRNNETYLNWSTANEFNSKGFLVQKSMDGQTFAGIGFVKGAGNSSIINNYSYTDTKVQSGTNFYRLKQIDLDGKFSYSSVIQIAYSNFKWAILGNPVTNNSWVQLQLDKTANVSLQVISINGAIIKTINKGIIAAGTYSIQLNLPNTITNMYLVRLVVNGETFSKKIIK